MNRIIKLTIALFICSQSGYAENIAKCTSESKSEICATVMADESKTGFFNNIFDTSLWPPRWQCGIWTDFHGWLYILSDLGIWLAYFTIPVILALFLYKRKEALPFKSVQILFIAFILACGLTHLLDAIIFWVPLYKLSALIRLITALVSISTAVVLIRILPNLLQYKSPEELERVIKKSTLDLKLSNEQLKNEIRYKEAARSETRYLLESLPILTFVATPDGFITDYNKQWEKYTGFSPQQSGVWTSIIHIEDKEAYNDVWTSCISTKQACECELRLLSKEGYYEWFLAKVIGIRSPENEDKLDKWIGTFTNIHQQKMIESRKDTFLNIASHELKTPLTGIKAYLQMQQDAIESKDYDLVNTFSTKAMNSTNKLQGLIQELLDVSRIQSGMLQLNRQPFSIVALVEEVIELFKYSSTHEIIFEVQNDVEIVADRDRIEQILNNFVSNAIKYSPKADRVILKTYQVDAHICIDVQDFGIGISKSDQHRLFDQFYRTNEAAKSADGLGMGLYIAQEIAKLHNGIIKVESEEGKGSTFSIHLPLCSD